MKRSQLAETLVKEWLEVPTSRTADQESWKYKRYLDRGQQKLDAHDRDSPGDSRSAAVSIRLQSQES